MTFRTVWAASMTRYHRGMLFSDLHGGPAVTWVADLRDYPEWHRGRERYGVWIVPIEDEALLAYLDQARTQLADLLHPIGRRQPHLTVFVCGFHGEGEADDDFAPRTLEQQMAALKNSSAGACALPLAAPDSFAGAAFIPVGDPMGHIRQWREQLGAATREIRQAPFVPHITLGLYRQRVTADVVRQRLGEIAPPPCALVARELRYVTYAASDLFGPLHTEQRLMLRRTVERVP